MKFAVFTVVVLALVFHAQSSVIPLGLGGIGPVLSVSGPLGPVVVPGGSVAIQSPVISGLPSSVAVQVPNVVSVQGLPAAVTVAQSPIPVPVALPAPVVVGAAPVVVGAEGTYVAKTRGAVHVAPLPGHLQSAASVNLQPAPGTL